MIKIMRKLSIGQNILIAILGIVFSMLLVTGIIFYTTFSQRTDNLVESQSREINKQIVLNYESYINSVIETANYVQYASLNLDVNSAAPELQDIYLINSEIKRDVVSILLFDSQGVQILGDPVRETRREGISGESWFVSALEEKSIFHFSAVNSQSVSADNDEQVISVSRSVKYTDTGKNENGVILIELNFRTITDLAEKTNLGPNGHILILDADDSLIYSSGTYDQIRSQESINIAVQNYFGGFPAEIDDKVMHMNITPLSQTRWRIVTVNDVDEVARAKRRMLLILVIIFIVSGVVAAASAVAISRRISSPMKLLRESMANIEKGDFYSKVSVSGQREVVHLAASFNRMIDTIRSLMEKVVEEQRDKRKTELRALQNQINPHFLYNTLDSIVWLAENNRTDDVITTVVALAKFFRISISRGETFIPVTDELSHIRNYLTIQQIRYQEKFTYTFEIDEGIYEYKVMKLILQPIVENAIYHGIGDEQEKITIRGYKENGLLIFEVENTGYGVTEERISEMYEILDGTHEVNSVGIRNVYQRLKLYYGAEGNIIITSKLDEMTNIKLVIPIELPAELPTGKEKNA
ncbi:MAG: sensor histidine kinase [Bacteroidetes bacterium]|nr:sensor histidine kinase [Bacteroidota bacterium]